MSINAKVFSKNRQEGEVYPLDRMRLADGRAINVLAGQRVKAQCSCCQGKFLVTPVGVIFGDLTKEEREWIDAKTN